MRPMQNSLVCESLSIRPGLDLFHTGPALDLGPLPTVFYFALSGPDSLCQGPFNQPVQFLQGKKIRVFSLTLPGHENGLPATKAISVWAEDIEKGLDPLGDFLSEAEEAIQFVLRRKLASSIGAMGLSRGAFLASHLAAREEKIRSLLLFAPMTKLEKAKEFSQLKEHPLVKSYDANRLADALSTKHVRMYIGNADTRVDTRSTFEFAMAITEKAIEKKIRSPQIELILTPSIGSRGHGTSLEVFRQGADWIADCLK